MGRAGFPKKPNQVQKAQINIPLNQLNDIVCSECGEKLFFQVFAMKALPALYSPNGKAGTVNVVAGVACAVCGAIGKVKETKPNTEGNGDGDGEDKV